jgi:hypothetical protein
MRRVFLTLLVVFSVARASFGQNTTFYYPHVADGILGSTVWKTTIFLTNPAASGTASGSISFMQDNANPALAGSPLNISFKDETGNSVGSGNVVPFQIAAGQTRKFVSSGAATYAGGFAVVNSNAAISGTAIFSEFNSNGTLLGEAGVPSGAAVLRQSIFVDTVGGYNLGVAYANPGTAAANITLTLLNDNASPVATTTQILGANNHNAKFVGELFPNAPQLAGTMQIVSNVPMPAIALRFDPTFSVFTTLPPVTLASIISNAGNALAFLLQTLHVHVI